MKKQFFRVKQLADQTFLRADKSEGLNHEELQIADHRVEFYRAALTAISKKLPPVGVGQVENADKRMKKYPEYQLGSTLLEQAFKKVSDNIDSEITCPLFQFVIRECGLIQQELAREQAEHESKVELLVSNPLQPIIENELPNIIKLKRNLNKYMLDKDSIKNRYHASKNGNQKDSLREDMEEAELKVEQNRDSLAAEMFNFLKKENELSQYMLQLLKLQRGYHESALKNLEKIIPELERRIGDSPIKPVFGAPLEEHLRVTNRRLAYPLELCISFLNLYGMSEEGLFRSTGGPSKIKRLKLSIDSGCFSLPLLPEYRDVHVIAATLKSYLRELPEPLLTYSLYNEWMSIAKKTDEERLSIVQEILKKLPKANKDNLTYLIQFLARLSKNHAQNKMTSSNIAICIAPNLLFKKEGGDDLMGVCSVSNMLVELFINNVEKLFTDDVVQYETLNIQEMENGEKDEFVRPVLDNVRLMNHDEHYQMDNASPRPVLRNKKKAPEPPQFAKHDIDIDRSGVANGQNSSYPSGSSTLNRSHRIRTADGSKTKASVGTNTDFPIHKTAEHENNNKNVAESKGSMLVNVDDRTADMCVVSQPAANYQISKAKPVQQVTAQTVTVEDRLDNSMAGNYDTVAKPVAAPRSINVEMEKSTFRLENPMTKSLNAIDIDGETVHMRSKDGENSVTNKPNKPAVPVRPASLRAQPRGGVEIDPTLHRTQCSVYSVANKQQPSIINVQNNRNERYQAGHDNQIAEKEKFLGHQQQQTMQPDVRIPAPRLSLENKFNDINSNCDSGTEKKHQPQPISQPVQTTVVPQLPKPGLMTKPPITKSTEKLNTDEKLNGNPKPSHIRTRSDGNIIDISDIHGTIIQTPPSPKVLNKPSQPPPPPPVIANNAATATVTTVSVTAPVNATTKKTEGDSTDF